MSLALAGSATLLFLLRWGDGLTGTVHLVGAERVLAGEVPYRDFWTVYAPGSYVLLAGLFALFGSHAFVSAAAGALLSGLAVGAVHRLALTVTDRAVVSLAAAAVVLAVLLDTDYPRSLNTYPPVLLAVAVALWCTARGLRGAGRRAFVAAGFAVGVGALFKHDVGAYTAVAVGSALLLHGLRRREEPLLARLEPAFAFGLAAALPVAGALLVLVPLAGPDLWRDLVVFPATDFRHTRPESYPSLLPWREIQASGPLLPIALAAGRYLTFALPTLAAAAGALAVALRRERPPEAAPLALAFALGFALHWNAAHLQINTHVVSLTLYGVALAALGFAGRGVARTRRGAGAALLAAGACAWLGAVAVRPAWTLLWYAQQAGDRVRLELPRVSGLRLHPEDARHLRTLRALVEAAVPADGRLFVGEHRHDMVIVSDTGLYFALGRLPATRYHELHPGIANTGAVQREMIRDLEAADVPLLILRRRFDDAHLDAVLAAQRRALPESGATLLDAWIRERYEPVAEFGRHGVWRRVEEHGRGAPAAPRERDAR